MLDPSHTWLTIHESVGHPLELDRVLGYEANYAGTSFATLDKREQRFQYGSELVNIFADKTQPGSLGAVGFDDEGVKCKRWDLIQAGKLVDYQTIRDQAHILGKTESDGCCYADSWSSVQFQRMANVSLAPGKQKLSVDDLVKDVENGIYIVGDGSFSIDQQRYNAQFGGQLFYEIKDGKIDPPAGGRGLPDPHAGVLERLRGRLRRARLPPGRLVLRRQGPAGPGVARCRTARPPPASTASTSSTPRATWVEPCRAGLARRHRIVDPTPSPKPRSPLRAARRNTYMSILTEAQAKAILDKVIALSKADECSASLSGSVEGNIRFALNNVSTSGIVEDTSLSVSVAFGKRVGIATHQRVRRRRAGARGASRRGPGAAGAGKPGVHADPRQAELHAPARPSASPPPPSTRSSAPRWPPIPSPRARPKS